MRTWLRAAVLAGVAFSGLDVSFVALSLFTEVTRSRHGGSGTLDAAKRRFAEYNPLMARNIKELFREAAQLPERDRATLAGLLLETLDPAPEPDLEAAWSEEIARRVAEIEAGTVETIPWDEIREELSGRRAPRGAAPTSVPCEARGAARALDRRTRQQWRGPGRADSFGPTT